MTARKGNTITVSISMPETLYTEIKASGMKFSSIFRKGYGQWKGELNNPASMLEEKERTIERHLLTIQRLAAEKAALQDRLNNTDEERAARP